MNILTFSILMKYEMLLILGYEALLVLDLTRKVALSLSLSLSKQWHSSLISTVFSHAFQQFVI